MGGLCYLFLLTFLFGQSFSIEYKCEEKLAKPLTFGSIEDYRNSDLSFKTSNWIQFTGRIFHLETDSFSRKDSNYILKLGLNEKELRTIDAGAFDELYCLKYLLLSSNILHDIDSDTFRGLNKVQEIDLSHNMLKRIPDNAFNSLENLMKIDLSFNDIKQLATNSFTGLSNLWELHLEHNEILDLPSHIFATTKLLHWLFLSQNRISVVTTPTLENLEELDTLDLSSNGITYIYEPMFKALPRTSYLDLSGNHLRNLDARKLKYSMPSLVKIDLTDNSWRCTTLEKILQEFLVDNISIVVHGHVKQHPDAHEVGCYDGPDYPTTTPVPVTTILPPNDHFETTEILNAIGSVKGHVIALLVIFILYAIINSTLKVPQVKNYLRSRAVIRLRTSQENLNLLERNL